MKKIMKSMDDEMKAFRVVIKGVAAIEKVELLAVVVEEQRLRIDAILQGKIIFFCVYLYSVELINFLSIQAPPRSHQSKRN